MHVAIVLDGLVGGEETGFALDRHLFLSLMIPAVFLGITGMIKCVVRREFSWENFYLGIDIALTAFANAIINIVDLGGGLAHQSTGNADSFASKMYYTAMLLVLAFGVLVIVMFIHQRLEGFTPADLDGRRWRQHVWLGGVSNLLGAGSLTVFIIARLKGSV